MLRENSELFPNDLVHIVLEVSSLLVMCALLTSLALINGDREAYCRMGRGLQAEWERQRHGFGKQQVATSHSNYSVACPFWTWCISRASDRRAGNIRSLLYFQSNSCQHLNQPLKQERSILFPSYSITSWACKDLLRPAYRGEYYRYAGTAAWETLC